MEKKLIFWFEVLFLLAASVYYVVTIALPSIKEENGSSDSFIKTSVYQNMFEITIDTTPNFSLVLNKDNQIYHILFFDKNASCLYNQDIEDHSIEEALSKVISILIENDYLKSTSIIKITRYGNSNYSEFRSSLLTILLKYDLSLEIVEDEKTLEEKSKELGMDMKGTNIILRSLDFYSKEFTRISSSSKNKEYDENN